MSTKIEWAKLNIPGELRDVLTRCKEVTVAENLGDMVDLACGGKGEHSLEVCYTLPDGQTVVEATVDRVRNGVSANYPEPYMRRRDPKCMVIADDKPTDKPKFKDRFGYEFEKVRQETFDWLAGQELTVLFFHAGRMGMGYDAAAVVPKNAGFFGLGLALLQGYYTLETLPENFTVEAVIYVAPPFRHTHFEGKQLVVHNRRDEGYEMFAYNLYPGPSAKKGVYGMLIGLGEKEGWVTTHCSTVQVVTPYDNVTTFMHEGASGGGKSEMLEHAHRLSDGRLLMGRNLITEEERYLEILRSCDLKPVTDDMALCHPDIQKGDGKLWLTDAEDGWFVRVNHISSYGKDLDLERLSACPPLPLLFLNIDSVPRGRALIWEHIEDSPGKPCPNPRVVIPRSIVPNVVDEAVRVDIRSLGVRMPPCTREHPTYGIAGICHPLPPALAWLWRLVAPRGHANPSILHTDGIGSEGVGSYWPFATGRRVVQANLLLDQICQTPRVRYFLAPNQHVGAWETGFMPQWIMREYLARRGDARFKEGQIVPARCPLLGYSIRMMRVEGAQIPHLLLETHLQPELGEDGFDEGAKILGAFFKTTLQKFVGPDLSPLGKKIIDCCFDQGTVADYEALLPNE